MNIKLCAFILAALAVSCGSGTTAPELTSPQDYKGLADEDNALIGLQWRDEPEAEAYVVSIRNGVSGGMEIYEVKEPFVVFTKGSLDPAETYYITVQTKTGTALSAPPQDPVVIKGETVSVADIVVAKIPVNGKPDTLAAPEGGQPFDMAVFDAERAMWEAQNLTHYRFTRRFKSNPPHPDLTFEVAPDMEPELIQPAEDEEWQWLPSEAEDFGRTIDEVYAIILERFAPEIAEDHSLSIRYNTEYHYPEWFESRTIFPPGWNGGGGLFGFEISGFERLD
jgi:hypothetical protein